VDERKGAFKMTPSTDGAQIRIKRKTPLKLKEVTLELTRKCPLRCLHCSSNGGLPYHEEIGENKISEIIADSIKLGARELFISGGEPFESENLLFACREGNKHGMLVSVFTSGNKSDADTIRPLSHSEINEIYMNGASKIIFSIHGADHSSHDALSGRCGSYSNLLKSIKVASISNLVIELNFVPTLLNYRSLPQVVDLANLISISKINILRFVPQGRGGKNREKLEMRVPEYCEFLQTLRQINDKNPTMLRLGSHFNGLINKSYLGCTAGIDKLAIRADGKVFPCVSMKDLFNDADGISLYDSNLRQIWISSTVFQVTRKYANRKIIAECSGCPRLKQYDVESCPTQEFLSSYDVSNADIEPATVLGEQRVENPAQRRDKNVCIAMRG
jgi:radical SAM protein with 4Fe4S-binding SPASM domain